MQLQPRAASQVDVNLKWKSSRAKAAQATKGEKAQIRTRGRFAEARHSNARATRHSDNIVDRQEQLETALTTSLEFAPLISNPNCGRQ